MKVKERGHWLHEVEWAVGDVHISILLLNANAHGRLYLWRSSSTDEDNSSCMKGYNEGNDMHNGKWTSAE